VIAQFSPAEWSAWAQFGLAGLLVGFLILKWIPDLIAKFREDTNARELRFIEDGERARVAFAAMLEQQRAEHSRSLEQVVSQFREALREQRADITSGQRQ
jgi:hypothetical protein